MNDATCIFLIVVALVMGIYGCQHDAEVTERNYISSGYVRRTVGTGFNSHIEWVKDK